MKRRVLAQLIEHARRVRDDAATRAAGACGEADKAGQTLDLLASYRDEQLERSRAGATFDAALIGVREQFTRRLDAAIDEQSRQRDRLATLADERKAELLERQRRLLAFETLQQRREDARLATARRADQRQTDELAAQAFSRRTSRSNHDS